LAASFISYDRLARPEAGTGVPPSFQVDLAATNSTVFTSEQIAGRRHIRIAPANPTARTRKHEVVSCSVADPFPIHLKIELQPRRPGWKRKSPSSRTVPKRTGCSRK